MCFGGGGGSSTPPEQKTEAPVKQKPASKEQTRQSTRARYTPEPRSATMITGGGGNV